MDIVAVFSIAYFRFRVIEVIPVDSCRVCRPRKNVRTWFYPPCTIVFFVLCHCCGVIHSSVARCKRQNRVTGDQIIGRDCWNLLVL